MTRNKQPPCHYFFFNAAQRRLRARRDLRGGPPESLQQPCQIGGLDLDRVAPGIGETKQAAVQTLVKNPIAARLMPEQAP